MARTVIYDQIYIKKCFDTWYLAGRPNSLPKIKDLIPPLDESGRKPSIIMIRKWMVEGAWDVWADDLDAQMYQQNDKELINQKAQMLREHQAQAALVTKTALEYLLDKDKGFDSAASAVQAFFRGMEEQRKTAGFSDLLEKLDKMTNNDVEREILTLLNRAAENDQVIETESEDIPQLENGEENG